MRGAELAATKLASTKRQPPASGGKVPPPATYLTDVPVVPPLPVNPETVATLQLNSPREAKETFVMQGDPLPDIQEGDSITIDGVEYIIRSVAEWQRPVYGSFLHLIIEEQK